MTVFGAAGARVIGLDFRAADGIVPCDVCDEASVTSAFDGIEGLTDVVHAAGIVSVGPVALTPTQEVEKVLRVNLLGSFIVARAAARRLPGGGTLTFISSQAGLRAAPDWAVYSASKAGVISLTQALAGEIGPRDIRVNAVCPGTVRTPMTDVIAGELARLRSTSPAEVLAQYAAASPLGRLADPADVANACLYLASPLAGYVNGAVLTVDGGEAPG